MLLNTCGLSTSGQTNHHYQLALVSSGGPSIAPHSLLLPDLSNLDVGSVDGVLPVPLVCSLLVNTKVDLKLDIPCHDVSEHSLTGQVSLGSLESIAQVLSVPAVGDVDLVLGEVNEGSLGEFLPVLSKLIVVSTLAFTSGVTPGLGTFSKHQRGLLVVLPTLRSLVVVVSFSFLILMLMLSMLSTSKIKLQEL